MTSLNEIIFREILTSLFQAKLRASFNNPEKIASRKAYFNDLINSDIHQIRNKDTNLVPRETFKKLANFNSDFSLKYSSIRDNRFGCVNYLIENDTTYPVLKKNIVAPHIKNSCKTCTKDRHPISTKGEIKTIHLVDFTSVNCLISKHIEDLEINFDIKLTPPFSEINLEIIELKLGNNIKKEFNHVCIANDEINKANPGLKIKLLIDGLEKIKSSNVKDIWRSQGYREKINSNLLDIDDGDQRINMDLIIPRIIELKEIIEEEWNPENYLGISTLMSGTHVKTGNKKWPILYITTNKSVQKIINDGLKSTSSNRGKKLSNTIFIIEERFPKNTIEFNLDKIELWR